jgi:antitoxin (DNA-binding transcriptional repressor) of toxin-antitoxin stability system
VRGTPSAKSKARLTVYIRPMAKYVIHISEVDAAGDFASLLARVRAGAEVVIENGERPVAVLHAADPVRRSISECIARAKAHEEETGRAPVLDPDFAEDVEEILSNRKPWNPPAWE